MSSQRTAWHFFFTILLRKRGPGEFEVRDEVPLSEEPPRLDYLLLRKRAEAAAQRPAETLRGLWPRLPSVTVAEFKSVGRPYRKGNLDRLWSYIHLYFADPESGLGRRDELCGLLIVTTRTPTLDADASAMGLVWDDLVIPLQIVQRHHRLLRSHLLGPKPSRLQCALLRVSKQA